MGRQDVDESQEKDLGSTAQPTGQPDVDSVCSARPGPDLADTKPEETFIVAARRRASARERKISSKGLDAMLNQGGGRVLGEDFIQDEYQSSDDAARRAAQRRQSIDLDDFEDDADDRGAGRRGGGRRCTPASGCLF